MQPDEPDQQKATFSKAWSEARYDRAQRPQRVYGKYHAPGLEPGGSIAWTFMSGVILAALVGSLLYLGKLGGTVIGVGVGVCLLVGLYMANEQRWLTEEHRRRADAEKAEKELHEAQPLLGKSKYQLAAMIDGQERLAKKRDSEGRIDEADEARRFAGEIRDELSKR